MKIALISLAKNSGCPPIGLVYLGTYLKKNLNVEVEIIDHNFDIPFYAKDYDLVGISAMTVHYDFARRIAKSIKDACPQIPVIIGGVHISTCPESFDKKAFDAMVIGEGEKPFLQLLRDYLWTGKINQRYENYAIENLDDLPRPNWNLVDKRYFDYKPNTTFGEFGISGVMLTSRGCPYNCIFCSTQKMWGNKVRFHSAEYVNKLIEDLMAKGVTHIQIWDDLFTINRNRLKDLTKNGSAVKFNCQPRADLIDDELCEILKNIGITTCIFGFESGSDRILKYLKRDTCTVKDNIRAVETCHRRGLKVQGSVMLGSPRETFSDMEKTIKFIKWCIRKGVQRIWSFVATPFPATEWWDNQDVSECSHYNIDNPLLLNRNISNEEFKKVIHRIYRLENVFKVKKAISFLKNNPIRTLKWLTFPS